MAVAQPVNSNENSTCVREEELEGSCSVVLATSDNVAVPTKTVNCLFCYNPVLSYNGGQTKIDRRLTIKTAERMFSYICRHLEMDKVTEFHETRKSKKEGLLRLFPGNLPLCKECKLLYYRNMYDAFVEYELAMAKFNESIRTCLTKAIAKSATKNSESVTVETDDVQETNQNQGTSTGKAHEVMKIVKQFRKKVVDKNPYGYTREGNLMLDTNSDFQNVDTNYVENAPESKESQPGTSERLCPVVGAKKKVLSTKCLPIKYYAVKQPAPGVIQIIPTSIPSGTDKHNCSRFMEQQLQKIVCKFCQRVFSDSASFTRHMVTEHRMAKPLKCSSCDYRCFDNNSLTKHLQTHLADEDREKPYQCEECGKSFRLKLSFKNHVDEHAGNRRMYTCDICSKQFNQSASRQLCIDKHKGIKRHECSFSGCGKRFLRKEVLKMHERVHTGEKPFKCDECGKCFSQRSPLQLHIKKMHNDRR